VTESLRAKELKTIHNGIAARYLEEEKVRAEHINPFILSTIKVFDTMVQCPLSRGEPYMKKGNQPEHEITGIVGYSGRAEGCVVISLSLQLALHATAVMLEKEVSGLDQDVIDAAGELANMIAGQAKKHLEALELRVTLPTVVSGRSHRIGYPEGVTAMCIPFDGEWGKLLIEFALVEVGAVAV